MNELTPNELTALISALIALLICIMVGVLTSIARRDMNNHKKAEEPKKKQNDE
jgi:hypothetical protein